MYYVITENIGFYNQIRQIIPDEIPLIKVHPDELTRCKIGITNRADFNGKVTHLFLISDTKPKDHSFLESIHFYKKGEFQPEIFLNDLLRSIRYEQKLDKLELTLKKERQQTENLKNEVAFLKNSLKDSGDLQKSVMTNVRLCGFDTEILYKAYDMVSGDLFLAEEIGEKIFLAIGDVTDHGYFSGMYGASLYSLAKAYLYLASKFELDVKLWAKFLIEASEIYQGGELKELESAAVCLVEIHKRKKKARFISLGAGNLPPIIIRGGKAEFAWNINDVTRKHLPPIGTYIQKSVTLDDKVIEVDFKKGDGLLLYTDGAIEVFKDAEDKNMIEEYSIGRLLQSVEFEIRKDQWDADSVIRAVKRDISGYSISKSLDSLNKEMGGVTDDIIIACLRSSE